MTEAPFATAVSHLRTRVGARDVAEQADPELLHEFAVSADQAAFAQLVRRHGSMVLGVCRRVLADHHDAEDAFQATFLVLARSVASVRKAHSLAAWLHGVAFRVSMRAKRDAARRYRREQRAAVPLSHEPKGDLAWREVQAVLDEEIDRLPRENREAFVLCCLDGLTKPEAARRVGVKEGTLSSRLARARERLRERLSQRGFTVPAALVVAPLSVSDSLASATTSAASGYATGAVPSAASSRVMSLAEGATLTMFGSKYQIVSGLLMGLAVLGASVGILFGEQPMPNSPPVLTKVVPPEASPEQFEISGRVLDGDGHPLSGATVVWRVTRGDRSEVETTTNPDGQFHLPLPVGRTPAEGILVASHDNLGPDWLEPSNEAGDVTLHLATDEVAITGRLLDLEGRPIEGASIRADSLEALANGESLDPWVNHWKKFASMRYWPDDALMEPYQLKYASTESLGLERSATSDAGGRFRLTGFGQERVVHLTITGKGLELQRLRVPTRENVDLERFALPCDFEITVGPGKALTGTVRDRATGEPVGGLQITCGSGRTTTDVEGQYRIEGLHKQDRYFVGTGGRGVHFFTMREISDTPGLEDIRYDLEVDQGIELRGKLLDGHSGKPIAGQVEYKAAADNPHLKDYPDIASQFTVTSSGRARGDGHFVVPAIPGRGWLCVTAAHEDAYSGANLEGWDGSPIEAVPHHLMVTRFHAVIPVDLSEGVEEPVSVEVMLTPGRSLSGRVSDAKGDPLPGAIVAGCRPISVRDGMFNPSDPLPGDEFTVVGIAADRERPLVAYHLEKRLAQIIRIPPDQDEPVTLTLEPMGNLTGRLVDGDDRPLPGIRVQAEISRAFKDYHDLPADMINGHMEKLLVVQTTDAEGRFLLEGLVPGLKYSLTASEGEIERGTPIYFSQGDLLVKPGQTRDLGDLVSQQ